MAARKKASKARASKAAPVARPEPAKPTGVWVRTNHRRNFWRCGIEFGPEPTFVPFGTLDLDRLRAEPRLDVTDQ